MGFFEILFGSGVKAAGEGVGSVLEGVGTLAKDIRQAITGKDPEAEAKLLQIEALSTQAQNEINKAEAAHRSVFVAGWRPFIGWICGLALGFNFIVHPILVWTATFAGAAITVPKFDMSELYPIVIAMLGLGVYRTIEKARGINDRH